MILWCDGAHDPSENMRRDAALLAAAEGGAEPVLRLFSFRPHGITLGHAQDPERELDLARCAGDDVPWAVRPTGGRAIFHAEEWTYSLAAPIADREWGGGRAVSYDRVSRLIAASLLRLGVPADLGRPDPGDARHDRPRDRAAAAPPCFASTARHEITLRGRKLVGSAQRRTARALLQQGSVLLGGGHLRLIDYLAVPAERRATLRHDLERGSLHAGPWLGADTPLPRWADALLAELPPLLRLDGVEGRRLITPLPPPAGAPGDHRARHSGAASAG